MTLTSLPLPIQKRIIQLLSTNNFVEAKAVRDAWLTDQSHPYTAQMQTTDNQQNKNPLSAELLNHVD